MKHPQPAKTFNSCTHEFVTEIASVVPYQMGDVNVPWCATKVDDNGLYIRGRGNWGNCGEMCPVEEGCNCIFPFTYRGITHNACTMHAPTPWKTWHRFPWCSTRVDDNGKHIPVNAAFCSQDCPFEKGKVS